MDHYLNNIIEFKASEKKFRDAKDDSDKIRNYDELLSKYSEMLEALKESFSALDKSQNKLPTANEVESLNAMLKMINNIDSTTLEKLNQLGGRARKTTR